MSIHMNNLSIHMSNPRVLLYEQSIHMIPVSDACYRYCKAILVVCFINSVFFFNCRPNAIKFFLKRPESNFLGRLCFYVFTSENVYKERKLTHLSQFRIFFIIYYQRIYEYQWIKVNIPISQESFTKANIEIMAFMPTHPWLCSLHIWL